jgi:radical SAM protein with 4Fe4S-binding SPASM domain
MPERPDFPTFVTIEPTSACNRDCFYCPRHFMSAKQGFMSMPLYRKLLDEIARHPGVHLFLFRRGESLLHKQLDEMIRYARDRVAEMVLTTNATILGPDITRVIADHVDFVHFSLALPAKYSEHRGGDYEVTRDNIERFLAVNTRARTQVSMVATKDTTPGDRRLFVELWEGKVDRIRIYEQHSGDGNFGSLVVRRAMDRRPCCKPFSDMVVYWDGQVGRCNHDWDGQPLGEVESDTIEALWNGPAYEDLRRQHLDLRITDETCRACDSWQESPLGSALGTVVERT